MKSWKVDCRTHGVYLALLKLGEKHGWKGSAIDLAKGSTERTWITWDGSLKGWENPLFVAWVNFQTLGIAEAVGILEDGPPKPEIRIGEYLPGGDRIGIHFNNDGSIKVGRTEVSKKEIEAIYKKWIEKQGGGADSGEQTVRLTVDEAQTLVDLTACVSGHPKSRQRHARSSRDKLLKLDGVQYDCDTIEDIDPDACIVFK